MRRLLTVVLAVVLSTAFAFAQKEVVNGPVITFESDSKDFGDIKQGDKVSIV